MALTRESQTIKTILTFLRDGHDRSRSPEEWTKFDSDPSVQLDPYLPGLIGDGHVRHEATPDRRVERYVLTEDGMKRLAELEALEQNSTLSG